MEYDLLQKTRDQNEALFLKGFITMQEYFDNETQLNNVSFLFRINLN